MQIALVDYRSQRYCQQDEAGDDEPGAAQTREEGAVDLNDSKGPRSSCFALGPRWKNSIQASLILLRTDVGITFRLLFHQIRNAGFHITKIR